MRLHAEAEMGLLSDIDENLFEDDDFEVDSEVPDSQDLDKQENDASSGVCIIFVF